MTVLGTQRAPIKEDDCEDMLTDPLTTRESDHTVIKSEVDPVSLPYAKDDPRYMSFQKSDSIINEEGVWLPRRKKGKTLQGAWASFLLYEAKGKAMCKHCSKVFYRFGHESISFSLLQKRLALLKPKRHLAMAF